MIVTDYSPVAIVRRYAHFHDLPVPSVVTDDSGTTYVTVDTQDDLVRWAAVLNPGGEAHWRVTGTVDGAVDGAVHVDGTVSVDGAVTVEGTVPVMSGQVSWPVRVIGPWWEYHRPVTPTNLATRAELRAVDAETALRRREAQLARILELADNWRHIGGRLDALAAAEIIRTTIEE